MSIAISDSEPERPTSGNCQATESIVSGLSFMLVANLVQRGIGFVRNIILCRFLTEDHLGLWALASSFFVIAAPLAVLGLPGTFGRMVESYRANGQLTTYLKRTSAISLFGILICISLLVGFPSISSTLIFGASLSSTSMIFVAMTLCWVILFNATTELLSGLRKNRVVSAMHTCNSLVFTATSLCGIWLWNDWQVLVIAFAIASAVGMLPAISILAKWNEIEPTRNTATPFREMWRRVLPFAISVWCMNLLINSFDLVDRYMLLFLSDSAEHGRMLVGQFHSGRIMPVLLSSLTLMISGLLLPYLAADWEAGRHKQVSDALRLTLKCSVIFFMSLSIASMSVAPMLFNYVLQGKYSDGLAIMPLALLHCCWAAIAFLMQNYFWCAERGKTVGALIALGLVANVALNAILVPTFSLHGAVLATSIAGGCILLLTLIELVRSGIPLSSDCYWFCVLPISLAFGTIPAAIALALGMLTISRTDWLLSRDEKLLIGASVAPRLSRLGFPNISLWHSS